MDTETPDENIQKLIDNCVALKMEPDVAQAGWGNAHAQVYETPERKYSRIWTKEDLYDNEPIYYYYRIQILRLNKDSDQEGNYLFVQNWGAFDTINHRKRSENLPLGQCVQKFLIQSNERSRNFLIAKIKDNNISKHPLPESVQELIAKYIFEYDFLKKMIDEYTFDIKSTISEFLSVIDDVESGLHQRGRTYDHPSLNHSIMTTFDPPCLNVRQPSYKVIRELLDKQITCPSADDDIGNSRTFSLMNFYYKQLHTTIKVLDKDSECYKIIEKYFTNYQSGVYSFNTKIENVFEIERPCDSQRFTKDMGNKRLLWHGTHRSNIPSILYEGFRTSKANSGGMFGAGTYFANSVAKSVQYCRARSGVLLLCEVALGDIMECDCAFRPLLDGQNQLADGKNSVHGIGDLTPNPDDFVIIDDDVLVPFGKVGRQSRKQGALKYDEFIVYHPAQIKMRYLITFS